MFERLVDVVVDGLLGTQSASAGRHLRVVDGLFVLLGPLGSLGTTAALVVVVVAVLDQERILALGAALLGHVARAGGRISAVGPREFLSSPGFRQSKRVVDTEIEKSQKTPIV